MKKIASEKDISLDGIVSKKEITHELYDKTIESSLIQPTFVTRLPVELVPLANS